MEVQDSEWDDLLIDELNYHFDGSCEVQERINNQITLVGLLIADHELPQSLVKNVLRAIWSNMGTIKVMWSKENVYSICVGDEAVARRLLDGNPWFIKGNIFTVKSWPIVLYSGFKPMASQEVCVRRELQGNWVLGLALFWKSKMSRKWVFVAFSECSLTLMHQNLFL
ncbi:hypothetical protein ACE6H2_026965 [Prunus campanulata]